MDEVWGNFPLHSLPPRPKGSLLALYVSPPPPCGPPWVGLWAAPGHRPPGSARREELLGGRFPHPTSSSPAAGSGGRAARGAERGGSSPIRRSRGLAPGSAAPPAPRRGGLPRDRPDAGSPAPLQAEPRGAPAGFHPGPGPGSSAPGACAAGWRPSPFPLFPCRPVPRGGAHLDTACPSLAAARRCAGCPAAAIPRTPGSPARRARAAGPAPRPAPPAPPPAVAPPASSPRASSTSAAAAAVPPAPGAGSLRRPRSLLRLLLLLPPPRCPRAAVPGGR